MKKIIVCSLLLCSLIVVAQTPNTPITVPASIKFEKNIVQKINSGKKERQMNYFFTGNGDYAAIKPEEKGSTSLIIYTKGGNMLIVNEKDKTIMVMNMGKFIGDAARIGKEMAEKRKDHPANKDSMSVKSSFSKTGKTKTICGYPAEEYEIKSEKGVMSVWYLKADFDTQLIYTMGMGNMGGQPALKNTEAVDKDFSGIPAFAKNYFMAEMERNGKKSVETISITKTDYSFSSAGYTIVDMGKLMKGQAN